MSIKQLAEKCNVCAGTIYRIAKIYGRMPTEQEVNSRNKKHIGRKKKYI